MNRARSGPACSTTSSSEDSHSSVSVGIGVGQLLLELVEDVVHGFPILPADRLMDRCRAPNVASTSG